MIKDVLKLDNLSKNYYDLQENIRKGLPLAVFGVSFSEKCHIAGAIDLPVIYIASDSISADKIVEEISQISGEKCVFLSPKDDVLLFKKAVAKDSLYKRLSALCEVSRGVRKVVTTFEALLQLFPSVIDFISLKVGEEYKIDDLIKKMIFIGYTRVEMVDAKGQFSVRGDIVDVFPINEFNPIRLDFFGDELESIKTYEITSKLNLEKIDFINIDMAKEIFIEDDEKDDIIKELNLELLQIKDIDSYRRSENIISDIKSLLEAGAVNETLSFIMPLLKNTTSNFLDFYPAEFLTIYDESKLLNDSLQNTLKEHNDRYIALKSGGEAFSFSQNQLTNVDDLLFNLNKSKKISMSIFTSQCPYFMPEIDYNIKCSPVPKYFMNFGEICGDIKGWRKTNYRVLIACGDRPRAENLQIELSKNEIPSEISENVSRFFNGVVITTETLNSGFIYHDSKLVIIGTNDLFNRQNNKKRLKRKRNDLFYSPDIGDYAVHEVHGIGLVKGIKKITTNEGTKDYVTLEYSGGDLLYVPVDQMDILSKYSSGENVPALNKIGGKEFAKIKERVKLAIKKMAIDLKTLYSERMTKKGFQFSVDNEIMAEFESSFEFEETEDQLSSIEEIKRDMESDKVMDRLLCGDVGYGKTEVALRAIFKAVLDGKQCALLCPTTILSEQHFKTCKRRFDDFGLRIEVINRFKNQNEQKDILKRLAEGKIDLIIGTHRLLSKDIAFNDLGLLVLDEEQRFGVEHKEKIKLLKNNVDTLTMTATPIPRTLHMSLTGIRDISTIETPPKERLPVQTYVVEETDSLIRDAIIRELSRDGQVFLLYNRVTSIYSFANKISALCPEAKITIAHGQMTENSLEEAINDFYDFKTNLLISTTIIENGIDLPRANTLIVIDSDRLGLSQLYQLKGRVGRSNRLAHAYFTYKRDRVMTETAYKRLSAIMEFTDMNSGFKIAMRDLEIRGAGNVLGAEQHGHMDKIGYELYSKLLREEMMGIEGNNNINLDIRMDAFIPDDFIENGNSRLEAYKQIAEIREKKDLVRVKKGLEEVYGELPQETVNLMFIALIKYLALNIKAVEVVITREKAGIIFEKLEDMNNESLYEAMNEYKDVCIAGFSDRPSIIFKTKGLKFDSVSKNILGFLNKANKK